MANKQEKNIQKAYEILRHYDGDNNMIRYYAKLYSAGKMILEEFQTEYILKNHDYKTRYINKVVSISGDFGEKLNEKYEIGFNPEKLKITKIIGEMGHSIHCYAQYRQSVREQLMYIPKKYLLTPLETVDYTKLDVDFSKYNEKTANLGRSLKKHQEEAVKFLIANRKCILADSMGLGKTTSAIVAALEGGFKHILVITTASVKSTWKREISLYVDESEIDVIKGSNDIKDTKFTIINYDILKNFYEVPKELVYEIQTIVGRNGKTIEQKVPVMRKSQSTGKLEQKTKKSTKKKDILESLNKSPLYLKKYDCVIVDEAHKLSNNKSIRYEIIQDFIQKASPDGVFLLTGTPLTNKPINLYHVLRLINAPVTEDYQYYAKRYCGARAIKLRNGTEVMVLGEPSNLNELRDKIKHLYIRRLASDIGGMVEKKVISRSYDLNDEQTAKYDKLWGEYLEAQRRAGNNDSDDYRQLVEGILVRQFLAREMVKNTIEMADDYLEYNDKIIIVCTFKEELEEFRKYYKNKCVVYDGSMTAKQKDKAEKEFMTNPKIKVFVGNLNASSVGITLTAANMMIFNSYSWVEADNQQMQDRIYRITQTKDVTCIYQLFTDSISQDMFDKVMRKGLMMNEIIKKEDEK